jgi:hypothetical protein
MSNLKLGDIIKTTYSGVTTYGKVINFVDDIPIVITCLSDGRDYPHYSVESGPWDFEQWPIGGEERKNYAYHEVIGNVNDY